MAAPTIRGVGSVSAVTSGNAGTPGLPTGWAADDIHFLFQETQHTGVPVTPTGGTGTWVLVTGCPQSAGAAPGGTSTQINVWWKKAVAGDTAPSAPNVGSHQICYIVGVVGADTTSPINISGGDAETSNPTTVTWPSVTTTVADCLILLGLATGNDLATAARLSGTPTNGNLTSITTRQDTCTNVGDGGGLTVVSGVKASAGPIGTTSANLVAGTGSGQGRIVIAVKSASGDANASGATVTAVGSAVGGAATGGASAAGATVSAVGSALGGAATGGVTAAGATVSAVASAVGGAATGGASAGGATVTGVMSAVGGAASTPDGNASGATVTAVMSAVGGAATGSGASAADGATVTAVMSAIGGTATGTTPNGNASGAIVSAIGSVIGGAATGGAAALGAIAAMIGSAIGGAASSSEDVVNRYGHINGSFQTVLPWGRLNGTWYEAIPYAKRNGVWIEL